MQLEITKCEARAPFRQYKGVMELDGITLVLFAKNPRALAYDMVLAAVGVRTVGFRELEAAKGRTQAEILREMDGLSVCGTHVHPTQPALDNDPPF